jgi:hypothetical protein
MLASRAKKEDNMLLHGRSNECSPLAKEEQQEVATLAKENNGQCARRTHVSLRDEINARFARERQYCSLRSHKIVKEKNARCARGNIVFASLADDDPTSTHKIN